MLLLNTPSHSEADDFDCKRPPTVSRARGSPWHFSTIFMPISSNTEFDLELSSLNTYLAKTCQLRSL